MANQCHRPIEQQRYQICIRSQLECSGVHKLGLQQDQVFGTFTFWPVVVEQFGTNGKKKYQ